MSIISVSFLLLLLGLTIVYFLVPKRLQWWVLLAASLGFYACGGWQLLPFVFLTALSTWGAALWISARQKRDKLWLKANRETLTKAERAAYKARGNSRRRLVLVLCLVLDITLAR